MTRTSILVRSTPARWIAAGWLTASLIVAQLAGLIHRVEHPLPWRGGAAPTAFSQPFVWHDFDRCSVDGDPWTHVQTPAGHLPADAHVHGDETSEHNCVAYDAVTLGDGPPLAAFSGIAAPPAAQRVASRFARAGLPRLTLGYRTRAPPAV